MYPQPMMINNCLIEGWSVRYLVEIYLSAKLTQLQKTLQVLQSSGIFILSHQNIRPFLPCHNLLFWIAHCPAFVIFYVTSHHHQLETGAGLSPGYSWPGGVMRVVTGSEVGARNLNQTNFYWVIHCAQPSGRLGQTSLKMDTDHFSLHRHFQYYLL